MQIADLPLLIVALIAFGGVFLFLFGVDARLRRMERELADELEGMRAEDSRKHLP